MAMVGNRNKQDELGREDTSQSLQVAPYILVEDRAANTAPYWEEILAD